MSNALTAISNELIDLIKTEYPRFNDKGRIELTQKVENANLGYEDCIIIDPQPDDTPAILTAGEIKTYVFNLVYFKHLYDEKISDYSDFAESLDSFLLGYTHHSGYWVQLTRTTDYNIDEYLPEFDEEDEGDSIDLGGFVMTMVFTKYKAE
jgi:hypothetical protein